MPKALLPSPQSQEAIARVVQHRNRRFSIRLEPIYWHLLERQAEQRNLRLGRYVGELAGQFEGRNFSSYLRVLCMQESERQRAQASLRAGRTSILDLVLTAFEPGLLLSRYRTIIAYNAGFLDWLGRDHRPATGSDLTSVIQVRTRRPLNDVWLDMIAGAIVSADVNVLHVQPGRVLAASARIAGVPAQAEAEFYAVLWISTARRQGRPTITGPGPQAKSTK